MFSKCIPVNSIEPELQAVGAKLGISPKVRSVIKHSDHWILEMDKLDGCSLADEYGDNPEDIPNWIWEEIRFLLILLFENNIQYQDITPYNFMKVDEKIFVIDFGDAYYHDDSEVNWFLQEFFDGNNSWNPDYK
jgi:tRNA A-37 threonylcarbamoyl transferase component Bud32